MNVLSFYNNNNNKSKEQAYWYQQGQQPYSMPKDDNYKQHIEIIERLTKVEDKVSFVAQLQEKLENIVNNGFDNVNSRLDIQNKTLQEIQIKCVKIGLAYAILISVLSFLATQFAGKIFNI